MKKSKEISLVLLTVVLASCSDTRCREQEKHKTYMRSDTTAPYAHTRYNCNHGGHFYVFRPYGMYGYNSYAGNYGYNRTGYYNSNIGERSNVGYNSTKGNVVRSGFGSSGRSSAS